MNDAVRAGAEPAAPERAAPGEGDERSSLFISSTEKAFRVLHAFDGAQRTMTLAEIARAAQLDRSSAQRIVHTLEALGYLRRAGDSKHYGVTCKLLQFSYNYVRGNELIDKASPYLLDISRTIGETTNLHELDGADVVFIARFPGQHLVNIDIAVGRRLPAYSLPRARRSCRGCRVGASSRSSRRRGCSRSRRTPRPTPRG